MRRSNIAIVSVLFLLLLPAASLNGCSQQDVVPPWNTAWSYRQQLQLPISTNDSRAPYQPIDLRITFENPCWTEKEDTTSIRICCWKNEKWFELESQIYDLKRQPGETTFISECNVIFLIPLIADGTERYFIYYNGGETSKTNYIDHVGVEDENYSASPLPDISAKARFYGIKEDGHPVYGVGIDGQLLDRACAQAVVKQKKGAKSFDVLGSDQIVSFAFSYYYGSKEKDESSSDQVFIDKRIFVDGNLMVEFGIITESERKDVQTTGLYRYYYYPLEEKRINVHVKHEMLKDAVVQGIDSVDGRFGSLISLKSRSATVESLNFGTIYPYLNFYGENEKIEEYQMNKNPATKDREWIISFKDDAGLGKEAWLCYGDGREGKANAVLFATNEGIVTSGTDERDGIQLKVVEKEYFNFLGTEIDYASINFGRNSYKPGSSHDVMIPSDLIVEFDAEVFASDTGGYNAVQKESALYQTLIKSRQRSGDFPFEREQKHYNVTVISHFGGTHLTYPRLSDLTNRLFPVMWVELIQDGHVIDAGVANRSLFMRAAKTFYGVAEGEYLVKVYFKWGNKTKAFTGASIFYLEKNTKVAVFCTWERTIKFVFVDQHGQGIAGVHGWLRNKDGVLLDENITQNNGELLVRAPYNHKDSYRLEADYKDFSIYNKELQKTFKKLNEQITLYLYTITVSVTDLLNLPPGVDITPMLITSNANRTIQLTPEEKDKGLFCFSGVPAGDYIIQTNYGDFIDEVHLRVPDTGDSIEMKFTAAFDLTIDLYDSRGNGLSDNDIKFSVLRDGQTVEESTQRTFSLPPAHYTIKAYTKEKMIGEKELELTNDRHLTFVTTLESSVPLMISGLLLVLFGVFVLLSVWKKFSISSLLKCLVILLVALSFFQPWWGFTGSSVTPAAEKNTAMYVNPGVMIETTHYKGVVSLTLAEMPDIFLTFLGLMLPLASLTCLSIGVGVVIKKLKKKTYALLLNFGGILLLVIILSSFYFGATKLTETSIGAVQGQGVITISFGSEEILMQSSWGLSIGFYLVLIASIIAVIALVLDIRAGMMQKKKWSSPKK